MFEILFQAGPFTIKTFPLFLGAGFVLGVLFLLRTISRLKMNLAFVGRHYFSFILFSLAGGRLLLLAQEWSLYAADPLAFFSFWDLRFSGLGGLYGLMIALFWAAHRRGEDFWAWLDAFMLSGLVFLFFYHLGTFFDGSAYGLPTSLPWGITFDSPNIPYINPIHPTQLYGAAVTFIIFAVLMRYIRRTHLTGMVGSLAFMLYSLGALGPEFLHATSSFYFKFSYAGLAILGFIGYIHCSHKAPFSNPA